MKNYIGKLNRDTVLTFQKSENDFVRITIPAGTTFLVNGKTIIFQRTFVESTWLRIVKNKITIFSTATIPAMPRIFKIFENGREEYYIAIGDSKYKLYFRNPSAPMQMYPLYFLQ